MEQTFEINTLHRGKYMLCFFFLLIASGVLCAQVPSSEVFKIVVILFTIPIILYLAVRWSKRTSVWKLNEENLTITLDNNINKFALHDIDHIRSLTRSGGNLYVIYFKNRSPKRYWRNKLFTRDDDNAALQEALTAHGLEFYKF